MLMCEAPGRSLSEDVLANFVSSASAVLFFKSLWAPGQEDFLTREEDRALAAGILCLYMSRVLLIYGCFFWRDIL